MLIIIAFAGMSWNFHFMAMGRAPRQRSLQSTPKWLVNGSHRIHGAGIFTNIYPINDPNVGKYTSTMDPMGWVQGGAP